MSGLTPEQEAATRPDHNIFVGASAGTGKTFVLTARVLRMMVTGTAPDHILCLTYTKAAAAVMANRIYEILGQWALAPEKELANLIFARTGEKADAAMTERARTLFAQVLDIPGGLKIQTIHSFCQSLLGRFPLEARLAPHFQILDEHTQGELLQSATEDVMDLAGADPVSPLKKAFGGLARQTDEEGFKGALFAFLSNRAKIEDLLRQYGGPEGYQKAIYKTLDLEDGTTPDGLLEGAFAESVFDEEMVRKLLSAFEIGSKSEQKMAPHLQTFLALRDDAPRAFAAYRKVFLTQDGQPKVNIMVKASKEKYPELAAFCDEEKARLAMLIPKLALAQVAENTTNLIRLGTTILQYYQGEKTRFGYLDYDDLILKTRDLLARADIAPWIFYKLDGGIEHILVDEAQDTNEIQWQMIEALAAEFFAGLGTKEEPRTLFAVGDAKQSIFRFQGAEPGEFLAARERTRESAKAADMIFQTRELAQSFRTTRAVLDVVDRVFTQEKPADGVIEVDMKLRHEASRTGMSGLVEVWPVETKDENPEKPEGWQLPFQQTFSPKPEAKLAAKMAAHIARLVESEEELKARGRPIRYGDIMVLVQRRGTFMDHLIRELKALNVPVAGSDRMQLSKQLAAVDLLTLGQFALLPEDDFTLAAVLKGPLLGLDDDDLMDLAIDRKGTLWQALQQKAKSEARYEEGVAFLKTVLGLADFTTPFQFYAEILGPLEGRKKFIRRLGGEVGDPLDEFLNLCLQYESAKTPSLQGFLKWFAASETQIKRDMERGLNEVRIMTVHGAKGLEAPIVYLPETFRNIRKRNDTLLELPSGLLVWAGKTALEQGQVEGARDVLMGAEKAELNRLLYVALTRAEDRLYVAGWTGQKGDPEDSWYHAIREAVLADPLVEKMGDRDEETLRIETPQEVDPESKKDPLLDAPTDRDLPTWALKPVDQAEAGFEALTPSKAEGGLSVVPGEFSEGRDQAIRRGTIIHKLLEILPDGATEKRASMMQTYLKAPAHKLEDNEQEDIAQKVSAILEDPVFAPIFAPGSRAELNLSGIIDGKLATGQVDRVAITDAEVLIVDYKSNRKVPEKIEGAPAAYIRQLQLYAGLLAKVYPGRVIRAALLWTETGSIMEIPPDLL